MQLSTAPLEATLGGLLLWLCSGATMALASSLPGEHARATDPLNERLLDRCCHVGSEKARESQRSGCKLGAREAFAEWAQRGSQNQRLAQQAEQLIGREPDFAEQCELMLGTCCLAEHRKRNCESGKQFAKSGSACMDVELSKEATVAAESFNDCCMSCSLGVLAARSNETGSLVGRCRLMAPLASSLSGQLYEQAYIECCQENLPRLSGALTETAGQPIDCTKSNPCAQRCIPNARRLFSSGPTSLSLEDRCDCFSGYKLALDGLNCVDVDECKLNQHTCNRNSEICDNIAGGFRCLAREVGAQSAGQQAHLSQHQGGGGASSELESGAQFVSLRLCPLGSRWSSHEQRCLPAATGLA